MAPAFQRLKHQTCDLHTQSALGLGIQYCHEPLQLPQAEVRSCMPQCITHPWRSGSIRSLLRVWLFLIPQSGCDVQAARSCCTQEVPGSETLNRPWSISASVSLASPAVVRGWEPRREVSMRGRGSCQLWMTLSRGPGLSCRDLRLRAFACVAFNIVWPSVRLANVFTSCCGN